MDIDYKLLETQLSVMTELNKDAEYTIPAVKLLDCEGAREFLLFYQTQIKGLDIQVAGTYLAASWRVLCTGMQYMIGVTDRWLSFSAENLIIQVCTINNYPRVYFILKDAQELPWPTGDRNVWREEWLGRFYQGTIAPVFATISAVTGLPQGQVWGQIPLGIDYYVKHLRDMLVNESDQQSLMEHYHYLVNELAPGWFGLSRSPFNVKPKWIDDPRHPGEQMRMKPTCCLAYRTDTGHGYCYSCPKMGKEERQAKYAQIAAASS